MSRASRAVAILLPVLAGATGPQSDRQRPLFMTGTVAWPALPQSATIEGDPSDDILTLRGLVPSARIGPASVEGAYRVLYVSRDSKVGRLEVGGIEARVTDACIRAHAELVVVRDTHCVMTGGPQSGGINMPFGLDVLSASRVLVEDSSFDRFQWRAASDRYWNGDGITIESGVASAEFRRVSANDNSDAGFDVRPFAIMNDVSASGNCRNFRFWSGGEVGRLTTGDSIKRGGISACSGIWLNGSASGPRPRLHIGELVVRMDRPGMIIEVETGPADIRIDRCDIRAPKGTVMVRFERGAGEVRLGRGCELRPSHA